MCCFHMISGMPDRKCRSLSVDLLPDRRKSDSVLVPSSQSADHGDLGTRIHTGKITRIEACDTSTYQCRCTGERLRATFQDALARSITIRGALILRRTLWSAQPSKFIVGCPSV